MIEAGYHDRYFVPDVRRKILWDTLVKYEFQKHIPPHAVVLDLGAGYGHFINAVQARRRIAVDIWPGLIDHLAPGVEALITDIAQLDAVADDSVDYVFSSNCFEHVPQQKFVDCLGQLRRKMRSGATLNILQPNFKYCAREYFDDYTHVSIYTEISLVDLLVASGFEIVRCLPRFMPFSIKTGLPVWPSLIRLYLASPFKPFGKQMFISAVQ